MRTGSCVWSPWSWSVLPNSGLSLHDAWVLKVSHCDLSASQALPASTAGHFHLNTRTLLATMTAAPSRLPSRVKTTKVPRATNNLFRSVSSLSKSCPSPTRSSQRASCKTRRYMRQPRHRHRHLPASLHPISPLVVLPIPSAVKLASTATCSPCRPAAAKIRP